MGKGSQQSSSDSSQTQTTSLPQASAEEVALRKQFETLGTDQQQMLQALIQKAQSGQSVYQLNAADSAQLDQAYAAANQQYDLAARQNTDYMAGGRGLRMSDTPIASQAIQQYGLGKAQLVSDRALQGLNLGFQANSYNNNLGLMAAQAAPMGLQTAYQGLFNERLAQPTSTGTATSSTRGSSTQPLMQTILQGTQAYNQMGQGTNAFASAGMKMAG